MKHLYKILTMYYLGSSGVNRTNTKQNGIISSKVTKLQTCKLTKKKFTEFPSSPSYQSYQSYPSSPSYPSFPSSPCFPSSPGIPRVTETGRRKKTFKKIYWGGYIILEKTYHMHIANSRLNRPLGPFSWGEKQV